MSQPRPSRRRGPSKGDQREKAILAVAAEMFARRPVSSITIDELASGAGISRSSFYFYFPSKHAVLAALVESIASDLTVGHSQWLDGTGRDDAAARSAARDTAALWRTHGGLIAQARSSSAEYRPVMDFVTDAGNRFAVRLAAKINRDRAAGSAPDGISADTLARLVDAVRSARFADLIGRADARADARAVEDVVQITNRMLYGIVADG